MTEIDTPWGGGGDRDRSEKVDVNQPKFFGRYSRSIEQKPLVTLLGFILISYETTRIYYSVTTWCKINLEVF